MVVVKSGAASAGDAAMRAVEAAESAKNPVSFRNPAGCMPNAPFFLPRWLSAKRRCAEPAPPNQLTIRADRITSKSQYGRQGITSPLHRRVVLICSGGGDKKRGHLAPFQIACGAINNDNGR